MEPYVRKLKVLNQKGIHARTAALIARSLDVFKAQVFFTYKEQTVNAYSILGLMMLSARSGAMILIEATGEDATKALDRLEDLFKAKFGEH